MATKKIRTLIICHSDIVDMLKAFSDDGKVRSAIMVKVQDIAPDQVQLISTEQ